MSAGDIFIEAIADAVARKLVNWAGCKQRLMGITAASEYLGMTERALREKCADGHIPVVKIDRILRFDRRDLDRRAARGRLKNTQDRVLWRHVNFT